ncbi:MAG TPA: type II toxin-antitoxin system VapC family toxin [Solirubrobacteraceae bacterium]
MPDGRRGGVLVDSSVLLDIFTDDPLWAGWSNVRLAAAFDAGSVVINPLVYAELSVAFEHIEALDAALPDELGRESLPPQAAFLAGRCLLEHRRSGGPGRPTIAGFCIAAHAAITGRALLTRDPGGYGAQLPGLALICP